MRNTTIKVILYILLAYVVLSYFLLPKEFSFVHMDRMMITSGIALLVYILKEEKTESLKGQYLTLSLIFLLGFIPTCFQVYGLYLYGPLTDLSLGYSLDYSIVPKSISLSTAGLIAYLIGNMSYNESLHQQQISTKKIEHKSLLLQFGAVFLFIVFIFSIDRSYFTGNYGLMMNNGGIGVISEYSQTFLLYFISAAIGVVSWNIYVSKNTSLNPISYVRKYHISFIAVIVIYSILILVSGDRGPLLQTIFLLGFSYLIVIRKKFNFPTVSALAAAGIMVFFFFGIFRATDFSMGFVSRYNETLSIMSDDAMLMFSSTDELARIIRAQHALIMHVEANDFIYIHGIIYPILGLIPGLGYLYTSILGISPQSIGSAYIATSAMGADHGMGTTCIGDLYISFGIFSVVIFMFLLGLIFRKIEVKVYSQNCGFIYWMSYITLLGAAVGIGRGTVFGSFRTIVFILIITWVCEKIQNKIIR